MVLNVEVLLTLKEKALKSPILQDVRFPPSEYYRFFEVLAAYVKPKLSVELGVNGGGGSLHLAKGNPKGLVLGVDVSNEYPENISYLLQNYPNFVFIRDDSIASAAAIFEDYGKPDIVFFDTVHTTAHATNELNTYKKLLGDNKCIFCFDDLWRAEMLDFWDTLEGLKVRMDELHPGSTEGGFGVQLYNYDN